MATRNAASAAARARFDFLRERQRVAAEAALRVAKPHAGFDAEPERGNGIRAAAMCGAASRVEIAHADEQRFGLGAREFEKLRQVLGEVLAVRVHRDGMSEAEFDGVIQSRTQGRAFAGIFFQTQTQAARHFRQ